MIARSKHAARLAAALVAALAAGPALAGPLDVIEDDARLLLFFVVDESSRYYEDQLTRIEPYATAFERQDIVPIAVIGDDRSVRLDTGEPLDPGIGRMLRERFEVDPSAAYSGFLIRRDGTIAFEDIRPISMAEIIAALDD